jgi:hypothetical protein
MPIYSTRLFCEKNILKREGTLALLRVGFLDSKPFLPITSIFREGVGFGVLVGFGSGFLVLVAAGWGLEVLVAGLGVCWCGRVLF